MVGKGLAELAADWQDSDGPKKTYTVRNFQSRRTCCPLSRKKR